MQSFTLNLNYDNKFDTLYISLIPGSQSYGEEDQPGLIVMRDLENDTLTGYTILHFKKKLERKFPFSDYMSVPIEAIKSKLPELFI